MHAFITGAGGFLGYEITRQLMQRGDQVTTVQRRQYQKLDELGAASHQVDLARIDSLPILTEKMSGCDLVFHVAAKAGVWGSRKSYVEANVNATQHILTAMRISGVKRLIYTSSPSVTFAGVDEEGIDANKPYPKRYLSHYSATKAGAERLILGANGPEWATVSLRPHLIWGPCDPHLVPRVVQRAAAGKLKIVGSGENLVDCTYIENAAIAHIQAGDCLLNEKKPHEAKCAGRAYFISNGEPITMQDLLNRILNCAALPPVTQNITASKAYLAGQILETLYQLLRLKNEPLMTRFVARQLSTHHWYNIQAAKDDFGYTPAVSLTQGFELLKEWFENGHGPSIPR